MLYSPSVYKHKEGFTLIEFVVTISIAIFLSSIVLANYPEFRRKAHLQDATRKTVLAVHEAQVSASAGKEFGGVYGVGFGVYFTKGSSQFVTFGDLDDNGVYGGGSELFETHELTSGYSVSDICTYVSETGGSVCGRSDLTVLFKNPYISSAISGTYGSGFALADVKISTPTGETRKVVIWSTGHVYAE